MIVSSFCLYFTINSSDLQIGAGFALQVLFEKTAQAIHFISVRSLRQNSRANPESAPVFRPALFLSYGGALKRGNIPLWYK